jgi:hypothetical protein
MSTNSGTLSWFQANQSLFFLLNAACLPESREATNTNFSAVDPGFIGGVMVSILSSSVVDRGFIGGVMVSILSSSAVDPDEVRFVLDQHHHG